MNTRDPYKPFNGKTGKNGSTCTVICNSKCCHLQLSMSLATKLVLVNVLECKLLPTNVGMGGMDVGLLQILGLQHNSPLVGCSNIIMYKGKLMSSPSFLSQLRV